MTGGIASFFASLDPQSQRRLTEAAGQALGAQHRSIGATTANAGRVRDYLASNSAYAQEQAQRAGMIPPDPNAADRSGVSDFQRQNHAFMNLQGDDLMPAPPSAPRPPPRPASGTRVQRGSGQPRGPVNPEQDEATHDGHRDRRLPPDNPAQDAATHDPHADRVLPSAVPNASGNDGDGFPWILTALAGAATGAGAYAGNKLKRPSERIINTSSDSRAPSGDRQVVPYQADAQNRGAFRQPEMQDAEWNYARPQERLTAPPEQPAKTAEPARAAEPKQLPDQRSMDDVVNHSMQDRTPMDEEEIARIARESGRRGGIKAPKAGKGKTPRFKG